MVSSWRSRRETIADSIRRARRIWLGLDFDGTLAAISDNPDAVVLPKSTRAILRLIALHPKAELAIISGRELSDLQKRVDLEMIAYSGNHGLEVTGLGEHYEYPNASIVQGKLLAIGREISRQLKDVKSVMVENKRLSLSVHYRKVDPDYWETVLRVVEQVVTKEHEFRLSGGKMVWEVRPATSASKGTAALHLRMHQAADALPIFIGDDISDEDVFKVFPNGITMAVGPINSTAARYSIEDHQGVFDFLTWLVSLLSEVDLRN